jgi:hypothetical protein
VDDLSKRTLRELLTLARERLGSAASRLKTRDEVLAALRGTGEVTPAPPSVAPVSVVPVVVPVVAPAPVEVSREAVIVRDFFRRPG